MPYHILFPHFTQRNSLFAIFQSLLCSLIFRPYAASVALYHLLSSVLAVVLLSIYIWNGWECRLFAVPVRPVGSACCVLAVVAPYIYSTGWSVSAHTPNQHYNSYVLLYMVYKSKHFLILTFLLLLCNKKTGYRKIAHLIHIHSLTASSSASRFSQIT